VIQDGLYVGQRINIIGHTGTSKTIYNFTATIPEDPYKQVKGADKLPKGK
jgi:hypothetical protein